MRIKGPNKDSKKSGVLKSIVLRVVFFIDWQNQTSSNVTPVG